MDIFSYDIAQAYCGYPYQVTDKINIRVPFVDDVIAYGDNRFMSLVALLCKIPSDMKSELYAGGVIWMDVSDFRLFSQLVSTISQQETSILFGDLDFSRMQIVETGKPWDHEQIDLSFYMYDPVTQAKIDDLVYKKIFKYLCSVYNIHPKVETAKGKRTIRNLIEIDAERKQMARKEQDTKTTSALLPLISSMCNSPGFKYKRTELKDVTIIEFLDSVKRIPAIMSALALMIGSYSGFVDTSKIPSEKFDWMRDLDADFVHSGIMNISH